MGGIFLDATTRFYANMIRAAQTVNGRPGQASAENPFLQAMQNAAAGQAGAESGIGNTSGVMAEHIYSTEDMTMEEYKQYIYDKIIRLPVNPSQLQDAVAISISEEGFAAMKADPEYEKWVLDKLKSDFAVYYPWGEMGESTFRYHHFGATKEEYRCECYAKDNKAKRHAEKRNEEDFWEKRKKRHEEYMELCEKLWLKRENEQKYLDRIAYYKSLVHSNMIQAQAIERATGIQQDWDTDPSILSKAAAELAQDFIFFKIPLGDVGRKV